MAVVRMVDRIGLLAWMRSSTGSGRVLEKLVSAVLETSCEMGSFRRLRIATSMIGSTLLGTKIAGSILDCCFYEFDEG